MPVSDDNFEDMIESLESIADDVGGVETDDSESTEDQEEQVEQAEEVEQDSEDTDSEVEEEQTNENQSIVLFNSVIAALDSFAGELKTSAEEADSAEELSRALTSLADNLQSELEELSS